MSEVPALSAEEYVERVLVSIHPLGDFGQPLMESVGLPLAEDVVGANGVVIPVGTVIGPRHVGLLAAAGRATIRSRPRARVVVLSSGKHLRDPGTKLTHPGLAYDANSWLLSSAARRAGAIAYRVGVVPDQPGAFLSQLSDQLVRADVVVTTGGIEAGEHDVVRDALAQLGTVWFGDVALHPGGVQGFGLVGEDNTPIFALPADPAAAYLSFQTIVLPALRKMMGMTPWVQPIRRALLKESVGSSAGRRQLVPGRYSVERGGAVVMPLGMPATPTLDDLAAANALIVLGQGTASVTSGEAVDVLLLDEEF